MDSALLQILERSDLSSSNVLQDCKRALQTLYNILNTQLKPGMSSMDAVQYVCFWLKHNNDIVYNQFNSIQFVSYRFVGNKWSI
jgi:hypothetical protein